jgi:hypothetical protein
MLANSEEVEALDVVMQKASVIKADIGSLESEISSVQTKINQLRISDTYEGGMVMVIVILMVAMMLMLLMYHALYILVVHSLHAAFVCLLSWCPLSLLLVADELRDELRAAHALASKIRKNLAEFKDYKPDAPESSGKKFKPKPEESEAVTRMHRNLYVGLSQRFSTVLGEMTKVADSFQRVDKQPTDQYYKPGMSVHAQSSLHMLAPISC